MKHNNLPYEIIHLILPYLSKRHLVHTSLVCRAWAILSEYYIYKDIYIHDNKQFKQWLISLKQNQKTSFNNKKKNKGYRVRTILFHSQVDLLQHDLESLQTLCPFVESISIKPNTTTTTNCIEPFYTILPAWKYTKCLTGHHRDSVITWLPKLHSQLTSAVFNYYEILEIFSFNINNNNTNNNQHHLDLYPANYYFPNLIDLQLDFAYMEMDLYALLEKLHSLCPNLKKLILTSVSFIMNQSLSIATTTMNQNNNNNKKSTFLPFYPLTSLSIYDSTLDNVHCYSYLLNKYPMLDTFNMDFIYDEYYKETSLDHVNTCLYLKACQPYLFNFLIRNNNNYMNQSSSSESSSPLQSLKSISLHFIGANQFIESIWSGEKFIQCLESYMKTKKKMNGDYPLEYLDLNYTRQVKTKKDILGLEFILKSKVLQKTLKGLSLNVYNNQQNNDDDNNNNNNRDQYNNHFSAFNLSSSSVSPFNIKINNDIPLFPFLMKLDLTSYPGFDINFTQLLDAYPHLKILHLRYAIIHPNHCQQQQQRLINESLKINKNDDDNNKHQIYRLQELSLSYTSVLDVNEWTQFIQNKLPNLTSLTCENVTFKMNHHHDQQLEATSSSSSSSNVINLDLLNHGIKKLLFKNLTLFKSIDDQNNSCRNFVDIEWLKLNEQGYSMISWYDGSMYNQDSNKIYGSSSICCKHNYHSHNNNCNDNMFNMDHLHDHQDNHYLQITCQYAEDILFC